MPTFLRIAGRVLLVAAAGAAVTRIIRCCTRVLVHMNFSGTLNLTSHNVPLSIQFRGSVEWDPGSAPLWIRDEDGPGGLHVRWAKYRAQFLRLELHSVDYSNFLRDPALYMAAENVEAGSLFWVSTGFQPDIPFAADVPVQFQGTLTGPRFLLSPEALPPSLAFLPQMTGQHSSLQLQFGHGTGTFVATP